MSRTMRLLFVVALSASVAASGSLVRAQPTVVTPETTGTRWVDQFGTKLTDRVESISAIDGAIYASGMIGAWRDSWDGFVRKYDPEGRVVWQRRFGDTFTTAGAISAAAAGSYVAGNNVNGPYESAAYIRHYDHDGSLVWRTDLLPQHFDQETAARGISATQDAVYLVGSTTGTFPGETYSGNGHDAFVRKYDLDGNVMWTDQFGTPDAGFLDGARGVAATADSIYVTGWFEGNLSGETGWTGTNGFIRKYGPDGNVLWTRRFGTDKPDRPSAVSVGRDGIYVGGYTFGAFPGETSSGDTGDAFVFKYDFDGNVAWTRQVGPRAGHSGFYSFPSVSATEQAVYLSGTVNRDQSLPGQSSSGREDAFVRKYGADGQEMWTQQFGTSEHDKASAISAGSAGLYVGGETSGVFPGHTRLSDDTDGFVMRLVRGQRSVGLGAKLLRRFGIAQGIVRAADAECANHVRVRIERRPLWKRSWRVIRRPITDASGFYRTAKAIRRPDGHPRPGRYRAIVPASTFIAADASEVRCERAASRVRWVPRP